MRRRGALPVGLAISALSIAILLTIVDIHAALAALARANPLPLTAILVIIPVQLTLRAFRWRYLLPSRDDGSRPGVAALAPILAIGYLGNTVMPARLGEPIRAYLVARRERLDFATTLGSIVIERAVDVATLAGIALLAAAAAGAPAWMRAGTTIVAAVGLTVIVLLLSGILPRLGRWTAGGLVTAHRRLQSGVHALVRFGDGAARHSGAAVAIAVVVSVITWLLDGLAFWLVAHSLGVELSYASALLLGGVTVLGTAIPSAPGYIGTFELAAVTSASALGVPAADGLALGLLAHVATTVPLAALGAASLVFASVRLGAVAESVEAHRGQSPETERRHGAATNGPA